MDFPALGNSCKPMVHKGMGNPMGTHGSISSVICPQKGISCKHHQQPSHCWHRGTHQNTSQGLSVPQQFRFLPLHPVGKYFCSLQGRSCVWHGGCPCLNREQSVQNHRKGKIHTQNLHGGSISSFFFLFFPFSFFF